MNPEQSFGRFVRQRRRELDLTQEELARRVGCAAITIRKIEADDARPSVQIAERLAMALAIPLDDRAEFVRRAREARPEVPLPVETPMPALEEIGGADLSGRAIRGYALGERIGAGGMGAVYRATQPLVEREVAVKIILPAFANHPDFIRRFEAEAQLVARLEHPHIVPLYDYWREPGVAYLVMRLLRGGSVQGLLQGGPLPIETVARLLEQICAALHSAHRIGVIHRDLKPGNVLLDEDANAYLADFGIAKNLGNPDLEHQTEVDALIGSPQYMSPEQIRSLTVRPQTDIYCLGVMLYEMLTGALPFSGPTPFDLLQQHIAAPLPSLAANRTGLPAALDAVIARAAAKAPEDRYPDVLALLDDFRRALSGLAAQPVFIPAPEEETAAELVNPYKGLRAFGEADAEDFFGRETLIQQLLARLSEGGELARFLAVVGPSGSGKSSVVRAGLVPSLRRGGLLGSENWFYVDLMPGPRPFEELEAALLRVAVNPPASLLSQLKENERGLLRAVNRILPADESIQLVLVIDQFEEIFTLTTGDANAERASLLSSLVTAAMDERSRVRILITLRADFIDRPLRYVDFGELLQRRSELVLPLTPDELERAILGPARRVGLRLEPGLVAAMIRDVGDQPGALPLLQYALTELFEKREGRTLTQAAYDSIGGVLGALGRRAEEVFAGLNESQQALARQLFLRLVTLGEGVEDTRRRVLRSELESLQVSSFELEHYELKPANPKPETRQLGIFSQVIEAFGKSRLLAFDHDLATRGATVEVAHEALLREWARLREWLNESRSDVRLQRQLAQAAHEWETAKREASYLLTGTRLAQFEGWAANAAIALTHDERAYLAASLAEHEQRAAAEQARQKRELEAARKLAETERARAEEQTQYVARVRTRNRLIAAAGVMALVLAVLAVVFGLQSNQNAAQAQTNLSAAQVANTQSAANAAAAQAASTQAVANADTANTAKNAALDSEATAQAEADLRATAQAEAEEQTTLAQARELAAAALNNIGTDPEQALLLALEAAHKTYRNNQTVLPEVESVLHQAVFASRVRFAFKGHTDNVYTALFTPDGNQVVSISHDGTVKLWEAATGAEVWSAPGEPIINYYSLAMTTDGAWLARAYGQGIQILDAHTGREGLMLTGHTGGVGAVAFSPDGTYLASGDENGVVIVWDALTGQALYTRTVPIKPVSEVAFSPDGALVASAGQETFNVWRTATSEAVYASPQFGYAVTSVAFTPDGKYLATTISDGTLHFWDVATWQDTRQFPANGGDITFSHDGRFMAVSGVSTAQLFDMTTGQAGLTIRGLFGELDFSPDGRRLVIAGADKQARIFDVVSDAEVMAVRGNYAIAYSADGQRLATGTDDFRILVSDAQTGQLLMTLTDTVPLIFDLEFSADGKYLASSGPADAVKIWDMTTGQLAQTLSAHQGTFMAKISFSPDGKWLATGSNQDHLVSVWDLSTGTLHYTLTEHMNEIKEIHFSPDGTRLATASFDGTARIWETATGKLLVTLTETAGVSSVFFSPDGKRLATSTFGGSAQVLDVATGASVLKLPNARVFFWRIAYSPDGALIAALDGDSTVTIWDAQTGKVLHVLPRASTFEGRIAFSPDSRYLAVSGENGMVNVYAIDIADLLALAQSRVTRSLTEAECQTYLHLEKCP
jgi:WD40 repeat protein/transcriptional regulator with XRE-family HTH domain